MITVTCSLVSIMLLFDIERNSWYFCKPIATETGKLGKSKKIYKCSQAHICGFSRKIRSLVPPYMIGTTVFFSTIMYDWYHHTWSVLPCSLVPYMIGTTMLFSTTMYDWYYHHIWLVLPPCKTGTIMFFSTTTQDWYYHVLWYYANWYTQRTELKITNFEKPYNDILLSRTSVVKLEKPISRKWQTNSRNPFSIPWRNLWDHSFCRM